MAVELAKVLPSVTFVLARCYRGKFKPTVHLLILSRVSPCPTQNTSTLQRKQIRNTLKVNISTVALGLGLEKQAPVTQCNVTHVEYDHWLSSHPILCKYASQIIGSTQTPSCAKYANQVWRHKVTALVLQVLATQACGIKLAFKKVFPCVCSTVCTALMRPTLAETEGTVCKSSFACAQIPSCAKKRKSSFARIYGHLPNQVLQGYMATYQS